MIGHYKELLKRSKYNLGNRIEIEDHKEEYQIIRKIHHNEVVVEEEGEEEVDGNDHDHDDDLCCILTIDYCFISKIRIV
eukprot:CAMPEP_0201572680 /NCGR_PEP_ID=MMETSP0190_2-20130828/16100_1 /ASSEMBLY_ACC=CAM_ASM_000263 /TAXON_ID=37353 /ORGANISM="Rosalina sp." /LENGTH=78 /DNA_ID=CAMNT_0047998765 /DNA_START=651 /DNA_END=887 /DNA_ORIENTATION=-